MDQASAQVTEITTNLDDASGEVLAAAAEALLNAGALDVWMTPIQMKKGRPAVQFSLLCQTDRRQQMAEMMIRQTGAFGVRYRSWDRVVLDRRHETIETELGEARAKVGSLGGRDVVVKCEFDDVNHLARRSGIPVREAMRIAGAAADRWLRDQTEQGGGA